MIRIGKQTASEGYFSKQAFALDWERQIIRWQARQEMPFVPGGVVHFPKDTCAKVALANAMHH